MPQNRIGWVALGVCLFSTHQRLDDPHSLGRHNRSGFLVGRRWRILPTYAAGYTIVWAIVTINIHATGTPRPSIGGLFIGMVPGFKAV
jgi:hypothetical protein